MANKTVNGKKSIVVWHVDYLKISNVESDVAEEMIYQLSKLYGKDTYLKIHRGKVHYYLGIWLYYQTQGKENIDMTEYLSKLLEDMTNIHKGHTVNPAANHLFEVNETAQKLSKGDAQISHTIVEKLLFLSKHTRPDILTGVEFLTTRVIEPDKEGEK